MGECIQGMQEVGATRLCRDGALLLLPPSCSQRTWLSSPYLAEMGAARLREQAKQRLADWTVSQQDAPPMCGRAEDGGGARLHTRLPEQRAACSHDDTSVPHHVPVSSTAASTSYRRSCRETSAPLPRAAFPAALHRLAGPHSLGGGAASRGARLHGPCGYARLGGESGLHVCCWLVVRRPTVAMRSAGSGGASGFAVGRLDLLPHPMQAPLEANILASGRVVGG